MKKESTSHSSFVAFIICLIYSPDVNLTASLRYKVHYSRASSERTSTQLRLLNYLSY